MHFNEEDFYECENLEAITDGTIASRQRGSDLHKVLKQGSQTQIDGRATFQRRKVPQAAVKWKKRLWATNNLKKLSN